WKIGLFGLIAAAGVSVLVFYGVWAQTFDMKKVGEMPERNTVFDVDGKIYSRLAGANRLIVPLSEVSPLFMDARGLLRAVYRNLTSHSVKEGASTITQQLARNSLPLGGRTLRRKMLEAM